MKLKRYISSSVVVLILGIIIGILVGLELSSHLKIQKEISGDGIINSSATLVGIIAATFILPLRIQPLLQKQSYIVSLMNGDLADLLLFIENLLKEYKLIYESKKPVTIETRKNLLDMYTKLNNRASVIKKQESKIDALKCFEEEVYDQIINTHTDIAANVLPDEILTEKTYLQNKEKLEAAANKIRDLQYDLS